MGIFRAEWAKRRERSSGSPIGQRAAGSDSASCRTNDLPPFSGIGANEYIMDVTHDAWISSPLLTPHSCLRAEHLVSHVECGSGTRISGETDFSVYH